MTWVTHRTAATGGNVVSNGTQAQMQALATRLGGGYEAREHAPGPIPNNWHWDGAAFVRSTILSEQRAWLARLGVAYKVGMAEVAVREESWKLRTPTAVSVQAIVATRNWLLDIVEDVANIITFRAYLHRGSVRFGTADPPADSLGQDGDDYVHSTNGRWWKKVGGVYVFQRVLVASNIFESSLTTDFTPDPAIGVDGNGFVAHDGRWFIKVSGSWRVRGNLKLTVEEANTLVNHVADACEQLPFIWYGVMIMPHSALAAWAALARRSFRNDSGAYRPGTARANQVLYSDVRHISGLTRTANGDFITMTGSNHRAVFDPENPS